MTFYGICGQPFIDLTEYLSPDGLDEVVEELARFYVSERPRTTLMFDARQEMAPEFSAQQIGFECRNGPPADEYEGDHYERRAYSAFFRESLPLPTTVNLRQRKHADAVYDNPDDFELSPEGEKCPLTMAWINQLPVDVCRVTVFFSTPGQFVAAHRDGAVHPGFNVPLIYLNPMLKPFYIHGPDGLRHTVNTKIATFNPMDFHGMDQNNYRSFISIRINGRWHEDFIEQVAMRYLSPINDYFAEGRNEPS